MGSNYGGCAERTQRRYLADEIAIFGDCHEGGGRRKCPVNRDEAAAKRALLLRKRNLSPLNDCGNPTGRVGAFAAADMVGAIPAPQDFAT